MTNITTTKSNALAIAGEIKKPKLILVEENTKLREYAPEEGLRNCALLVAHLGDLLGISGEREEVLNALVGFITENYGNKSIEEILHAFNLFMTKELDLKVFKQIDAVVFGEVMQSYEKYKIEKLKSYRRKMKELKESPKEPTPAEIKESEDRAITDLYLEYSQTSNVPDGKTFVYDILFKRGELPKHTPEFRATALEKGKKLAKAEAMTNTMSDSNARRLLKISLELIESGKHERVATNVRKWILAQYFTQKINENKFIEAE